MIRKRGCPILPDITRGTSEKLAITIESMDHDLPKVWSWVPRVFPISLVILYTIRTTQLALLGTNYIHGSENA